MRRASMLAAVVAMLVVAFAGAASAALIACTGGRCEGTPQSDGLTGTDGRDRIFAFNGYDVCKVNENDDPVVNCEKIETEPDPTPVTAADAR